MIHTDVEMLAQKVFDGWHQCDRRRPSQSVRNLNLLTLQRYTDHIPMILMAKRETDHFKGGLHHFVIILHDLQVWIQCILLICLLTSPPEPWFVEENTTPRLTMV